MEADQRERLESLLDMLSKRWGPAVLQTGQALPVKTQPRVSTGFSALDQLLGDGLRLGQAVTLLGRPTSGMTTVAYKIVAQAQATNAFALYVDLDSTFDPDYAARCGITLERLFLARPELNLQMLDVARDLLESRSVGAIVFDLGRHPVHPDSVHRLTYTLRRSGGLILLLQTLSSARIPSPSQRAASLQLLIERRAWLTRDEDIRGYQTCITRLMPSSTARPSALIDIDFDDTIAGEPL